MCQQQAEGEGGASALQAGVLVHLKQLLQMHPEALLTALKAVDLSTTLWRGVMFPQQILYVLASSCAAVHAPVELRAIGASLVVSAPRVLAAPQRPRTRQALVPATVSPAEKLRQSIPPAEQDSKPLLPENPVSHWQE
jgi:hypothetical protein